MRLLSNCRQACAKYRFSVKHSYLLLIIVKKRKQTRRENNSFVYLRSQIYDFRFKVNRWPAQIKS